MLLHAIVHSADIQDRDGGILLLATLYGMHPLLRKLFADAGYQGPKFQKALAKTLPNLEADIVRRSDHVKGFAVLPKRWIVERTIAWLNRCRRLAKDWENLNRKGLAFLRLASIRLMLRKQAGRKPAHTRPECPTPEYLGAVKNDSPSDTRDQKFFLFRRCHRPCFHFAVDMPAHNRSRGGLVRIPFPAIGPGHKPNDDDAYDDQERAAGT